MSRNRIIRLTTDPPCCPLCEKTMREFYTKKGLFYACTEPLCMVSIAAKDPCCGKWMDKWPDNAPKCPLCKKPMRWFFRALDKLVITQCRGGGDSGHRFFQIAKGDARMLPPLRKDAKEI